MMLALMRRGWAAIVAGAWLGAALIPQPAGAAEAGVGATGARAAAGSSPPGAAAVGPARAAGGGDVPAPRTDANSVQAHRELLDKRHRGRIDVYFIGDSITRRWGAAEPRYAALLAHWKQSFHGWNAANFAWGGDTTGNMLWRLDNGELDGLQPRVIVLMAGTNNLSGALARMDEVTLAEDVVRGIDALLQRFQALAPQARIVLMGITPRNDDVAYLPVIRLINAQLARRADGDRLRFIDLWSRLADEQGTLKPGMADPDGLHLALPAYQQWADALKPVLAEWLGPPAAEDFAPPPTGDPSAMGTLPRQ